ncbi:unnamed protein product [Effrenium voratum]|uniref:Uncharacterized protein n=1 Tax=Effrenium voratum TaxID=2562239 RepID=A0AA36HMA1_9DINO|nr:unnamed protein product [Effrenium voratum]CAJ1371708.1 unnamed protein product [Effrenium voratum]CAJ1421829.1 unnamed protein product [Effrenium voratum]|mmetsp:Transcript_59713/g.142444  ORF Transcript_59713/g.142444 Transcript_59713/m.142444 type:complete len:263 (+) Transcript_59713:48-836(+)
MKLTLCLAALCIGSATRIRTGRWACDGAGCQCRCAALAQMETPSADDLVLPPEVPPPLPPMPPRALPPIPSYTQMTEEDLPTLGPPPPSTTLATTLAPPPPGFAAALPGAHQDFQADPMNGGFVQQGDLDDHYYQYVPGSGYFRMESTDSSKVQVAKTVASSTAGRASTKGCECMKAWSYNGNLCSNYCCNPDNDASGAWCFVKDMNCQQDSWGPCTPVPGMPALLSVNRTAASLPTRQDTQRHLRASLLQSKRKVGSECAC